MLHHWILDPEAFDLIVVGQARLEHYLSSLTVVVPNRFPPLTAAERGALGRQPVCEAGRDPCRDPLADAAPGPAQTDGTAAGDAATPTHPRE
ncbi:hypothetical protein ACQ86G_10405 [Roseateles chitinivorans]|uniref:hypothetical protein n=1 Tax=Roseateles chitinivorans TaxID=2917965 RepID=UPI003D672F9F